MEEKKMANYTATPATKVRGPQGSKMINQYMILDNLGEGSYGKVKSCRVGNDIYAIKIFNKGLLERKKEFIKSENGGMAFKTALQDVQAEITIMHKVNHPNVLHLHECMEDEEEGMLYMVLDYAEKGQILDWDPESNAFTSPGNNQDYNENQIRHYFRDMLRGLNYLHESGIIHRDIKPQNILIDGRNNVKIADLGQAVDFDGSDIIQKTVGTYHFFPPEWCSSSEFGGFSGKAADIWALGVSLFAMVYKKIPYNGSNVAEILEAIELNPVVFPNTRKVSDGLNTTLHRILDKNPATRATMQELFADPWVNEGQNYLTP